MIKNIIIGLLLLVIAGGAGWYYLDEVQYTPIGKILENPRDYDEKTVTVEGKVTDGVSFGVAGFIVEDETGEIMVMTTRAMPKIGSTVRIKGKVEEVFALGKDQMLVIVEETPDKK
jgi:hypothetical protein